MGPLNLKLRLCSSSLQKAHIGFGPVDRFLGFGLLPKGVLFVSCGRYGTGYCSGITLKRIRRLLKSNVCLLPHIRGMVSLSTHNRTEVIHDKSRHGCPHATGLLSEQLSTFVSKTFPCDRSPGHFLVHATDVSLPYGHSLLVRIEGWPWAYWYSKFGTLSNWAPHQHSMYPSGQHTRTFDTKCVMPERLPVVM